MMNISVVIPVYNEEKTIGEAVACLKRNHRPDEIIAADGGSAHGHKHAHHGSHAHVHEEGSGANITPWALFIIFVLGPCEPLIPILMYPAAKQSFASIGTLGSSPFPFFPQSAVSLSR